MPGGYTLDNGASRAPWLVSGIAMGAIIPCAQRAGAWRAALLLRRTCVHLGLIRSAPLRSGALRADTMRFMMPLNKQLLLKDAAAQPREWKGAKLRLWGTLHHARTAASCAALGLIVYQVFSSERD
jgi:hypothetical protein